MTRRNRIGLATLGVVAAALGAIQWHLRDEPGARLPETEESRSLETFTLDEVRPTPRPRGPIPLERPPATAPVDLGEGVVATIQSVTVSPGFDNDLAFTLRRGATLPSVTDFNRRMREIRQRVTMTVAVKDPAPPHDQDHPVRIAGVVARRMTLGEYFTGNHGPPRMAVANVDVNVQRVSVEIGMPAGPFLEVERMVPGDAEATRPPGAPAEVPWRIYSVEDMRGRLVVVLTRTGASDETFEGRSWLLQAVCHDGRVILPTSMHSSMNTGLELTMNVPFKEVAYVVYRCRPLRWQSIGEVDLPPTEFELTLGRGNAPVTVSSMTEVARVYREYMASATQSTEPGATSVGFRNKASTRPDARGAEPQK